MEPFALRERGHADVPIGDHAPDVACVVDDRHAAAVVVPHDLRGAIERFVGAARRDILRHELRNLHRGLLLSKPRIDSLKAVGSCE